MDISLLRSQLQGIGFDPKEATIYLALLELGEAPASQVAQNSKLNRVTTYGILEEMVQKGYAFHSNNEGVTLYEAQSPETILSEAQVRIQNLQSNLPFLLSLHGNQKEKPTVRFFDGIRAVKRAYREALESRTEILNYSNAKRLYELWPQYKTDYIQKRADRGIHLRGLYPKNKKAADVQARDQKLNRETRFLDETYFSESYETKIFDGKILLAAFDPSPFAIIIESQVLYTTQKQIFELVWKNADLKP